MKSLHPLLGLLALSIICPARASRTGLNNIPIAETSAPRTGVVQGYSTFGPDRKPAFLSGVRVGLLPGGEKVEAGFDTRWKPGQSVPVFFNAKWVSHWSAALPALGVGVASLAPVSSDRDRLGQPQTYGVLSYGTPLCRLHAGYAAQRRNNAAFFGLDRSWQLFERKLTFRSDLLQIQHGAQWLASAGFTYKFTKSLGIELWENTPTKRGKSYTTCKLGWSFTL